MNKRMFLTFLLILALTIYADTKKISRGRSSSSSRGSSRKTNSHPQPVPTSFSNPQASAPKPTLFGWQERPAQKTQSYSPKQSNPRTDHSYPSSNTGLSGNNQPKKTAYEENVQRSNVPVQQHIPTNNQMGHSYPASKGLSGDSGSGSGYPQGSGLSGQGNLNANRPQSGINSYPSSNGLSGNSAQNAGYGQGIPNSNLAPPPYQANNPGNAYRPPGGGSYTNVNNQHQAAPPPYSNVGNNYHNHPQGPPPPYSYGQNHGGYGNAGGVGPQMPGYYGNYMSNGKGFGGMSRSGSSLAGVGLAGAGIGTVLTGLALWNLARSTGHSHHTVIYDNRGQPIAVAPDNSTAPVVDSILGDLVNCTLTISNDEKSEVLAIPCSIATSFTPEADVKDVGVNNTTNDNTKCIITVVTKAAKEYMTTIPCSILLNTAAQNNVTEPLLESTQNATDIGITTPDNIGATVLETTTDQLLADQPSDVEPNKTQDMINGLKSHSNCSLEAGDDRDPINPCFSVKHNLTVVPIETSVKE